MGGKKSVYSCACLRAIGEEVERGGVVGGWGGVYAAIVADSSTNVKR